MKIKKLMKNKKLMRQKKVGQYLCVKVKDQMRKSM